MTRRTRHIDGPEFRGHPGGRRRPGLLVPVVVMALVAGVLGVAAPQVAEAAHEATICTPDRAAMVPKDGVLFGVNLDWQTETLAEHAANLGHKPAVAVQFSDIPYDRATWARNMAAVEQMKTNGGILVLTLEPNGGLQTISDDVIGQLIDDLAKVNAEGVPVILRFAHEMNGSWYAWGQQPTEYISTFRRVALAVHASLPGTSMMWAPSYGGGYGFVGGQFGAKPGTADFAKLDTDHDGQLTMADDPYGPYYPGDAYVDWVGISLYHWGNHQPWGDNEVPEPGKFLDMLTGTYDGTAGNDSAIPNFYQVYGVDHHKPVAVVETAAIYSPGKGGASELAIKSAWWDQVLSEQTHRDFPDLKMINWFEWSKYEIEVKHDVDWRASGSKAVGAAFRKALPDWLDYADDVKLC